LVKKIIKGVFDKKEHQEILILYPSTRTPTYLIGKSEYIRDVIAKSMLCYPRLNKELLIHRTKIIKKNDGNAKDDWLNTQKHSHARKGMK